MQLKSKYGFLVIIAPIFIIFGILFFFWLFEINLSKSEKLPIGGMCFFITLISLLISTFLFMLIELKEIKITEDKICFNFILKRKTFEYKLKEIEGWNELITSDKFGQYYTFNLKMTDSKIFMIQGRLYKNYNKIVSHLINYGPQIELGFYQNLIPLLKIFILTFIVLLAVFYISYLS
ncbi:hypothetical protein [Flavobacterium restrictum]|uniref:PH domain-containing protein n=1 Tax=Flavobacterium restrictum TaxID=2594428 RepID=A0A553DKY9_9FLAO|nr:hypothetical protein [Flavobacterium restrictum]TRX33451.1 hypothetical protein FNW21_16110 [Flavobacterium restrictum]